ncbi:MAG TPA: hypothetical protein VIV15_10760, partial [Anaerolineales bacterium]
MHLQVGKNFRLAGQPPATGEARRSQLRLFDERGRRGLSSNQADHAASTAAIPSAGGIEQDARLLRGVKDRLLCGAFDPLPVRLEVNDGDQEGVSSLIFPERKALR